MKESQLDIFQFKEGYTELAAAQKNVLSEGLFMICFVFNCVGSEVQMCLYKDQMPWLIHKVCENKKINYCEEVRKLTTDLSA